METHVFKLTSGVECEVKEFTGKHQRLLTEKKGKKTFSDKLNEVLADVLVRVGSNRNITVGFVEEMLSSDRRKALVETRQFTMDDEPVFEFNYEYVDSDGNKQSLPQEVDLSEGFPSTPLQVIDGDTVKDADYKEYDEIVKLIEFVLPRSGKKCRITLLDGKGEKVAEAFKKSQLSSHTPIKMRNAQVFQESKEPGKDGVWIQADLDKMGWKDLKYIRSTIKEMEGSVDTEIQFEHPEAEDKEDKDKFVIVDLLSEMSFFFPSGAI